MSESEKVNSAKLLWRFRIKNIFQVSRSDIRMGTDERVGDGELYMQRLLFEFGRRRRSIRIHVIHRADSDNCLHDHPWAFWAFVIYGGYVEEIPATFDDIPSLGVFNESRGFPAREEIVVKPFRIHRRPLNYKHRIIKLLKRISITIAYAGPVSNHWGFHTNHGKEIWEDFVDKDQQVRVGWCATDGSPRCTICGQLMPPGEEMFKYHGYSGPCPVGKNA